MANRLLQAGADPTLKDYQGLSAIDHAVLQDDEQILLLFLGQQVASDFEAADAELNSASASQSLDAILARVQEIVSGENDHNLTPLQEAVLKGDTEALASLLEAGHGIQDTVLPGNISLLHLAAMGNSPKVINILVQHGADFSVKDNAGRTPLHFAAANANGQLFSALVKAGAEIRAKEENGVSAVATLGAAAHRRDPLNISHAQALMFVATTLQCAVALGQYAGVLGSGLGPVYLALTFAANWSEFTGLLTDRDKSWKKAVALIGMIVASSRPGIRTLLQAWSTYHVASAAFKGLNACYNNIRYRTWKATRNMVIHAVNTAASVNRLWEAVNKDYDFYSIAITGYDREGFNRRGYDV